MTPLAQAGASAGDINPLDEIRDVGNGINAIDQDLQQLRMLQDRALNETESSPARSREIDNLTATIMNSYRGLVHRIKILKGNSQAQSYRGQIDRLDRQVRQKVEQYQQLEAEHRRKMADQMGRQYLIVEPNASKRDVDKAVEEMMDNPDGGSGVFAQALRQSNRQGQANAVRDAVRSRHAELEKIAKQMSELTQLMEDLNTAIIQQEPMVAKIEERTEVATEDLKQANIELDTAVETVRGTRKKKWICCGIVCECCLPTPPHAVNVSVLIWKRSRHPHRHHHHRCRLLLGHQKARRHHHRRRQAKPGRSPCRPICI